MLGHDHDVVDEPNDLAGLRAENRRLRLEVGLLRKEKHAVEDRLAAVVAEHRARAATRRRRRWPW